MTNAVAIVAHYDDAVIWAGGAIRRTAWAGWNWTIVCTCAGELNRRRYFLESCAALGGRAVALEFADHPDGSPFSRNDRTSLCGAVRMAAEAARPDWVFAHSRGPEGEYGPHPNHIEAAEAAAALVVGGSVRRERVAYFAYSGLYGLSGLPSVAGSGATHYLPLDYDELRWKADWCSRANGVEMSDPSLGGNTWLEKLAWPCPNPEAFMGDRLDLPSTFLRR